MKAEARRIPWPAAEVEVAVQAREQVGWRREAEDMRRRAAAVERSC